MVPQVDWANRNPYSEARCGPQDPEDAVKFVWYDTVDNTRLPMLQVMEPECPEGKCDTSALHPRRVVAEAMGRKLAPFAQDVRWALWVFDVILRVVVPDGMVTEVLEGLPEEMVVELEGYAEGLNAGLPKRSFLRSWGVIELCRLQLLPDLKLLLSPHNPKQTWMRQTLTRLAINKDAVGCVVGCSTLINHHGIYRNMDWISLGVLGSYTILIKRIYPNGAVSIEVSVPMLLGTVTAVLCRGDDQTKELVAMNVTNPTEAFRWAVKDRIPAAYYNRLLVRDMARKPACLNVSRDGLPTKRSPEPLGPYHLSIGRPTREGKFEGHATHFYQGDSSLHACRKLNSGLDFVLTCNGNYLDRVREDKGSYLVRYRNSMHTNERTETIRKSNLGADDGMAALQLTHVNNFETVYNVKLEGNNVSIRVNNGFAATAREVHLPEACFEILC